LHDAISKDRDRHLIIYANGPISLGNKEKTILNNLKYKDHADDLNDNNASLIYPKNRRITSNAITDCIMENKKK